MPLNAVLVRVYGLARILGNSQLAISWQIERTKKHHIYVNEKFPGIKIPVGKHGAAEVPKGTLNSILKQAGLK